jgi:predicted nucleotidyltransferase component of viral defense system
MSMDLESIRRVAITALAADDYLADTLVLKGGNALRIAHQLGDRASLDLDYSMAQDFDDLDGARGRIERVLKKRFAQEGLTAFDVSLTPKPPSPPDPTWGGYRVEFKLVDSDVYRSLEHDLGNLRRRSLVVSPNQKRLFRVDISKHEYVHERITVIIDDYSVFVYPLRMIAAEKLRAICQQLPEYEKVAHKTARARDFYDIWLIAERGVELVHDDFGSTLDKVFGAKNVPLHWVRRIVETREFHAGDWAGVRDTVASTTHEFDYYFGFVVDLAERLEAAGIVKAPG